MELHNRGEIGRPLEDLTTTEGREKYYNILQTVFMPSRALIDCIAPRRTLAAVNLCDFDGYKYYHAGHGSIINPMGEVVGFFMDCRTLTGSARCMLML